MRTNIILNDMLIKQAVELGEYKTKKEAVEEGLKLLIRIKQQQSIRKYKGKLKWEGSLDDMRLDS